MFTNPPGFAFAHRTRVAMPRVLVVPGMIYPAVQAYGPLLSRLTGRARIQTKELEIYADPAQVPPEGYNLDTEVQGIIRAADEAGWDTFNLVGYSAGGLAALAFIEKYPERLTSVALIEPFGTGLDEPPEAWTRFPTNGRSGHFRIGDGVKVSGEVHPGLRAQVDGEEQRGTRRGD